MADSRLTFDIIAKDNASGTFARVATNSRLLNAALDDVNSNGRGLAGLSLAPSLVPTLAVASASAASLSTALASAGGAGGIFGLAVGGTVVQMKKQQEAITQAQKKLDGLTVGSKEYANAQVDLTNKQRAFHEQFGPAAKGVDQLKSSWAKFQAQTSGTSNDVIAKTLGLISSVLPRLVPAANAAGRAVGGLVDELSTWAKSPAFDRLLNWFGTSGVTNITRFGHVIGNLFVGLGGIFANFAGPGDKAAASLEKLTARFAAWGNSKGVSESVQHFLNFASANGDKVASVLGSLAQILPKLAGAFSGIGSISLTGAAGFLNLIASLPAPVFNAIATGIFAISVASKAVRVAVAAWAAVQWVLNAALTANPIGLVVVAVAALVAGLIIAYKKSETFRNVVDGALKAVGKAAIWLWNNAFQPALRFIVNGLSFMMGLWGKMLGALSHVPGFGWARSAANVMNNAANQAHDLAGKINKIPTSHNTKIGLNAGAVYSQLGALNHALDLATRPRNVLITRSGGIKAPTAHAVGGSVVPGQVYRVGERGIEDVVFGQRGYMNTAEQTARMGSAGTQAVAPIVINVNGALDANAVGVQIEQILAKHRRTQGGRKLAFQV